MTGRTGSAAQIRNQVSVAFSSVDGPGGRNTLNTMSSLSSVGAGAFLNQTLENLSQPTCNPVLVSPCTDDVVELTRMKCEAGSE